MSNADVLYYNLTIGNNNPANEGNLITNDVPANITALNNLPIIHNPEDYYCSIIRFQIPALTLPLINVLIQTPVEDINKTIYSFTITDLNNNPVQGGQQFVMWQPQVELPASQIPKTGTAVQTLSEYYLCYSYNWFIRGWNNALNACWQDGDSPPFFAYDATTQLISLYTTVDFSSNYRIWINNSFLTYFVGMGKVNVNQSSTSAANGLDNVLMINENPVNQVFIPSTASRTPYYKTDFEYSSFGYWNFLKSIIITTTMNVVSEVLFNNNQNNGSNVNYINILEDYYPDLALQNGAGVSSQIFTYNATSLYRIFSFNQKNPLYKVDLGISFVDTYGNIYPLLLPKGQLANFKLMFIKKSVYNPNLLSK